MIAALMLAQQEQPKELQNLLAALPLLALHRTELRPVELPGLEQLQGCCLQRPEQLYP
jgi:hypothetical protein